MTTTSCSARPSAEPDAEFDARAYDYELPPELIAQRPPAARDAGRLLVLDRAGGGLADRRIADLPELLAPGDLLVFNDTRVLPARLRARKPTGGRVEILLERILAPRRAEAQLRCRRAPALGSALELAAGPALRVLGRRGRFWELEFPPPGVMALLERLGEVPLPPYIDRAPEPGDRARYQTVYARAPGAVAAPTAGLHFSEALLARLRARGVERTFVTLHIGAGTFRPLAAADVRDHRLHAERVAVPAEACARARAARAAGRRVIAVGTTVARALETAAAATGAPEPFAGETRLYLHPGRAFAAIDALLTNFHLPRSSLLVLVSAFAGRERVLAAYRHAVAARYRFYSYGDAMLAL